jgi:hypothetical protein
MPWVSGDGWPDQIGRQFQHRVVVEFGGQAFFGKFDSIALNSRKGNFQGITIGPDGVNADRFARLGRRCHDRLGGEIEWDTEDVGILDIQQLFLVEIV